MRRFLLKKIASSLLMLCVALSAFAQGRDYLFALKSSEGHNGDYDWVMKKASEVTERAEDISRDGCQDEIGRAHV